jgi:hypothetical protein
MFGLLLIITVSLQLNKKWAGLEESGLLLLGHRNCRELDLIPSGRYLVTCKGIQNHGTGLDTK